MARDLLHDGRHYDALHARVAGDLPYYKQMVSRFGGPVLELACGTGRIALPLARAGHRVVGVDAGASRAEVKGGRRRRTMDSSGLDVLTRSPEERVAVGEYLDPDRNVQVIVPQSNK